MARYKLAVLDANFYWTEQLFSACGDFADVLLLRPHDFRAFHQLYGSYFTDLQPQPIAEGVWQQRICCPPGWLFHYWFLTRCFFTTFFNYCRDILRKSGFIHHQQLNSSSQLSVDFFWK